jgi:hypothetical protein
MPVAYYSKAYPRAPKPCDARLNAMVRSVTLHNVRRCTALLHTLHHHSTMDAVLCLAMDKLERSLRDECRKRGIDPDAAIAERLAPKDSGKAKPPESLGESAGPMIVE